MAEMAEEIVVSEIAEKITKKTIKIEDIELVGPKSPPVYFLPVPW